MERRLREELEKERRRADALQARLDAAGLGDGHGGSSDEFAGMDMAALKREIKRLRAIIKQNEKDLEEYKKKCEGFAREVSEASEVISELHKQVAKYRKADAALKLKRAQTRSATAPQQSTPVSPA